jgi:hypothetical protein
MASDAANSALAMASSDAGAATNGAPGDGSAADGSAIGLPPNEFIRPASAEGMASGGANPSASCTPLSRSSISDFTFSPGDSPTNASFGVDAAFVGGTYAYPNDDTLTSDVTGDDWHLSGRVNAPAGFGLFWIACPAFDASAFVGISFTLSGSIEAERELTFFVESAAQQVSHLWPNANEQSPEEPGVAPNAGRCFPTTTRYDGSCREPRVLLAVPPLPTTIEIAWTDLVGGSPVASIDPTEITAIAWALPQPTSSAYAFDIHIDDLRFIEP